MEILLKISDVTGTPLQALNEVATLLSESEKNNEKLLAKGRTKIDLVGDCCLVNIQIKEEKQPGLPL